MDKILKIFKAEVKSIDVEKKRAVVVISTDKKDRDGDIVMPESFRKNIKNYKDHPVLLSSHDYGKLTSQIGQAHNIKINAKDVEAEFEWFAGTVGADGKSLNPEADWAWFLAQKKIAAFSIGFQSVTFDWIEEKDEASGNKYIVGRKFTEISLFEVSQVLVPSNAGALQNSINNGYTPVVEKELCELVLKGVKDGVINFKDFSSQKEKKDDTNNSEYETRICAMEKCMEKMQSAHDDMAQRLSALEVQFASNDDGLEDDMGGKGNKEHYSKTLLGDEGKDPKHTPDSKAELDAIKQAFK